MKKKTKRVTVWVNWWGEDLNQDEDASIHLTKEAADIWAKGNVSPRIGNKAHKLTVEVPVE